MSRVVIGLACAAALLSSAARAEQAPRSGGYDPHVQLVAYNPLEVVRIVGSTTNSTEITFAPGEKITQVAVGDSEAWLAQPAGNLLFIKPTAVRLTTNMQVVTESANGEARSYQFRLVAASRGPQGESAAIYAVSFTYPREAAAARAEAQADAARLRLDRASETLLSQAWAHGARNWRYVAQGSRAIEPVSVSDNGRQTAFRFPGHMRVPTIYTAAPDGSETIVPYAMRGDTAVVQTTSRIFTLRDGQKVLRILNQAFDPVGRDPGTGTGTPALTRMVRSGG